VIPTELLVKINYYHLAVPSAAMLQKKHSTQSHEVDTKYTKRKK